MNSHRGRVGAAVSFPGTGPARNLHTEMFGEAGDSERLAQVRCGQELFSSPLRNLEMAEVVDKAIRTCSAFA